MRTVHNIKAVIEGIEVEVTYDAYPEYKGASEYRGGPPIEPDEPASFEVTEVNCEEDIKELLADHILKLIDAHVEENHADEVAADAAAYADHLNDMAKDEKMMRDHENGVR